MPAAARSVETQTIFVNGAEYRVDAGLSVAAALVQIGKPDFSTDVHGNDRGVFCGMGVCHDCLVTIDGKTSQRACMTLIKNQMQISRQQARPDICDTALADLKPVPEEIGDLYMDLLVVGAGPGGLSAAIEAARAGAKVVVVDEREKAGGQFYKQPATECAANALDRDQQAKDGARLINEAISLGVTLLNAVTVWGAAHENDCVTVLSCLGPNGVFYCHPKLIVISTGAFERPAPIKGWTLPGVMTSGAAQTLLRSYGTLPGKRILIAGNGPLNIQVALEITKAGGEVVCLVERARAPWKLPVESTSLVLKNPALAIKGLREIASLERSNVTFAWDSQIDSIAGNGRVQSVSLSGPKGRKLYEVDTVLLGGDFTSSNELSRLLGLDHKVRDDGALVANCQEDGESSISHIHVVGEAVRFGGAHVAMAEGRLAGRAIARKLGHHAINDYSAERRIRREKAFQTALWALFKPATTGFVSARETIACRCENVTLAMLSNVETASTANISTLKRLTRSGMGRCQGRYCSKTLTALSGKPTSGTDGVLAPQMPLRPIPIAALAVEKPEWGGHKRALLPKRQPLPCAERLSVTHAQTLVIGAGIVGLSTAMFLAQAGHDVVVLERGYPGALASGGNAGSLHAQLLSFDHGARAEGDGGAAARTLPLQSASIDLWKALQSKIGRDFEMKITGGLMVAETEEQLRFLVAKTAVERRFGVECHVIGKDELHRLEPSLSPQLIGAAYCPQEGKINPLVATRHIMDGAISAGARVFDRTDVLSISKERSKFVVHTSRGTITAGHVVNASGAFASTIGEMLGLNVPVFGAPLQMIVTEAAAPTISHLVAHADRHLTLKQAANGNFLIGGGWTAGLDPIHSHPRPLFSSLEGNLWVAQHVVPGLRKLHVIRSWAAMNINIDGAPILGEHPSMSGFFNAVTSNGYTLGPLVGRITAGLIVGQQPDFDLSPFSISRF